MVVPNLIHGIPITLVPIDRAATKFDPDTREPIQQAARGTPVIVQGQPKWVSSTTDGITQDVTRGGPTPQSRGYVLFRVIDLLAAGLPKNAVTGQYLDFQCRISKMGNDDYDLYIIKFVPLGHYTDQNGPTLVKAHHVDRDPGKQPRP